VTDALPLRLDLAGLQERYAPPRPPTSPRARRVLLVLGVVTVLAVAVVAMRAVLSDGLAHLLVAVVPGVLLQALPGLAAHPSLQPQTRLSPEELDVRSDVVHRERVPWGQVVDVRPAGRWEDSAHVEVAGGRLLPLPGVPPADVVRVREALAAARERAGRGGPGDGGTDGAGRD